jgi:hypothetical protein
VPEKVDELGFGASSANASRTTASFISAISSRRPKPKNAVRTPISAQVA